MCSKQNKIFESKRFCLTKRDCLTKHISCVRKSNFDDRKRNLNQKWNNVQFQCGCKNLKEHHVCEKDYFCNPATRNCENYLGSIIDDSVITCDEIIDTTKTLPIKLIPTITVPAKSTSTNCYILRAFY